MGYPYPYTKKKAFRGIYIYIYIYLLIGTTILYSNIIKKEKQTNKEHTIILSRRSTLSSVDSIPSEQLLGIYLLFGTKKKAEKNIVRLEQERANERHRHESYLLLFIVSFNYKLPYKKTHSTLTSARSSRTGSPSRTLLIA